MNGARRSRPEERGLGLVLGRHLSVPAGSPHRSDRAIRRLERRLEGALARLLGPARRMRGFGARSVGEAHALYLTAWRESLADGATAEVGAYYLPSKEGVNLDDPSLRPGKVHWTLQISPPRDRPDGRGYAWYGSARDAACALKLAAGLIPETSPPT